MTASDGTLTESEFDQCYLPHKDMFYTGKVTFDPDIYPDFSLYDAT